MSWKSAAARHGFGSRLLCTMGSNSHVPSMARFTYVDSVKVLSSSSSFGFSQTKWRTFFQCTFSFLFFFLAPHQLMFCPRHGRITHRCIRLPVFQQSALYEWVLKMVESCPFSDVSILDRAWQLWRLVWRDRAVGVLRDKADIFSERLLHGLHLSRASWSSSRNCHLNVIQ